MTQTALLIGIPIASGLITLAYNRPAIYLRLALWLFGVATGTTLLLFAALMGAMDTLNEVLPSYKGADRAPVLNELARLDGHFATAGNAYLLVLVVLGFGAWLAHNVKKDNG